LPSSDSGIPCFPCRSDKTPACRGGFRRATVAPELLTQLWRRYPGELIGVPTGEASGLFVVDVDSAKRPEAGEWLQQVSPRLPETRRHQTRSGGLHLIFKHRSGLKTSAGKLAIGVDTRGKGRLHHLVAGGELAGSAR
jgi:bifunctional DNA primase/polymerase-like protein